MIQEISTFPILGFPLVAYLGAITFLSFLFTALIGYTNFKGTQKISFRWHPRMAVTSIILAIIHGILGLAYLGIIP
ncbi:MAG: hypothetical protein NT139_01205 [Candidatus Woesearchaeota archaeon]|nr:hypothetical protein [Candidatus Woesearchaeota archaeon]